MTKFVIAIVAAVVASCTFVKTSSAQTELPGSQVRVEKLFDARLADAERVQLPPSLPALDTSTVAQRYEAVAVESDIDYEPPKIRPLAVKTETPGPAYKGYARAGAGLPLGWIGDLAYVTRNNQVQLRTDVHTYGVRGTQVENQDYSEVRGRLGGTYYADRGMAIDLDFDYDRRAYNYYGFAATVADTSVRLAEDQSSQHFGVFGIRAGVRNAKPTPVGIDYRANVDARFLNDNFATKERNVLLGLGGRRDFGDDWYAEADVFIDLTTFEDVAEQNLNNYAFRPVVGAHFDKLGLRVGINVANAADEFRLFPLAEVSYALGGGYVAVAGIDGGLRKNNYESLTRYLPWLVVDPELRNAEERRGYVGLQGQTRGVTYEARAGFARVNNLALFGRDDSLAYQFRPQYDTANIVSLNVSATMPLADRLSGTLIVDSRFINPETADEPFLLPSLDAAVRVNYELIDDRATVQGGLTVQNGLPFAVETAELTQVERTEFLLDLSVQGDYWITEKLGAFLQLNNLLNNRREKFPNYPIVGTNVMVGLTGRF